MDNTVLLIANILTFVGSALTTIAALFKAKRRVLLFQSVNHALEIAAQSMTQAYSGAVQEVIALIYGVVILFVKSTKKAPKVIITALCLVAGVVLGVVINVLFSGNVWYGYLPIVAGAVYTFFVILAFFSDKDELKGDLLLKIGLIINVGCWATYGWFIRLYPVLGFNVAGFVFAAISIVRILLAMKRRKNQSASPDGRADLPSEAPRPDEKDPVEE